MTTNIVTAAFGAFKVTRTRQLYQYDYGQILRFAGIDLPDAYTVHFSNRQIGGDAVKQVGDVNGVQIPDEMLTSGQNVYAWVFLHTGTDDGETMYAVTIPVQQRPKPTEEEPTPVQQGLIEQAIAALNAAVEQTGEDVEAAAQSAETAQAAQEAAETAQSAAETASGTATGAASAAAESARQAAQSASNAALSASGAADSAAAASGSATSAANSASAAATSETNAASSANAAAGSANDASGSASAAAGSAAEAKAFAHAVSYEQQTLTDGQKAQARTNIGAGSTQELDELKSAIGNVEDELFVRKELTGNPIVVTDAVGGKTDLTTSASKVYVFAKNMVAIAGRTAITTGDKSNLTVRDLTGYKLYVGLGSSNYFNNGQIDSYSVSGETITVTNKNLLGYGLAFTIPHVVGGAKMVVTWTTGTNFAVKIGFYNNGTYISNFVVNSANLGKFEVPVTANQLIVCIEPSSANTTATATGLQLEYAVNATPYTAPIIPEEYAVSNGSTTLNLNKNFTLSASDSMSISYLKNEWSFEDDYATPSDVATAIADAQKSWFYGKKICTFGDSITNMNKWQPFMAEYLGCVYTKHGVGGCTVALSNNADHQTDCMYQDARINELENDADVILVFGGHNDWSNRVPIGSFPTDNTLVLEDTGDVDTFVYAYALMLKKLMTTYPNAKIYTMSCLGGRWDDTGMLNYDGHYYINGVDMEDYADAVKMVSAYYGIPCIDVSSLSGINTINHATYLADAIHPNEAGGKLIAKTVVRELLRFEPIDYTSNWDDIKNTYNVTGS